MSEVKDTWFLLQYLKDGEDDFEEFRVNFCGLISYLSEVEIGKLLKIRKLGNKIIG